MNWTVEALGSRLVGFRNLAIAVGLILFISLAASVGSLSWRPLLGLLLPIPICGVYWWRDATQVGRWQERILDLWEAGRLDLDVLAETLRLTPGLPHPLLFGMLETLPTRSRGFPRIAPELRPAIALTIRALNRRQWGRTAIATLAYSLALGALAWASLARSSRPIAVWLLIIPSVGASHFASIHNLRSWRRRIVGLLPPGDTRREFAEVVRRLDWGPIPPRKKERWIEAVVREPSGSPRPTGAVESP